MPGQDSRANSPEGTHTFVTFEFNIDNGAGTTEDDVFHVPRDLLITRVRRIYTEASDSSMGSATTKVGTTAGGAEIVASWTVTESQSIGAYENATLVERFVAAGGFICVRHTGIAATQVGKYKVQVEFVYVA